MIHQNPNFSLSYDDQTIVALCTPQGAGAIALIRLSGNDAFDIADRCSLLASKKLLSEQPSHSISYGWVIDGQGRQIDQVLFLSMRAPRTFTGQDIVEITCHNNSFLIEKIIDRILECGARRAGKGEFTQRAVMLGKMDLLQAEAMNDLIHAQTSESLKYSLQQLQGSLSAWIHDIETSVLEILAYCEGSFEFLDEEMEFASDIEVKIKNLIEKIKKLLITYPKQQYIKEGIKIALIGSVNAGKSSLFNSLLNKNRAIVTPIAGTTRDSIEASVFWQGEFITFIDTAGIRYTNDQIEKEGIDRSFQQAAYADIILLVVDSSEQSSLEAELAYQEIMQKYQSKIIVVQNKIDLGIQQTLDFSGYCVYVSTARTDIDQVKELYEKIQIKIAELKNSDEITCLLNKRQHDLLAGFLEQLHQVLPMVQVSKVDYELVSYRVKEALQALSQMTGRNISQAAFDKVFDTFCVGK